MQYEKEIEAEEDYDEREYYEGEDEGEEEEEEDDQEDEGEVKEEDGACEPKIWAGSKARRSLGLPLSLPSPTLPRANSSEFERLWPSNSREGTGNILQHPHPR